MSRSFWNKKIPTFIGMFLLVAGVITTSLFVQQGTTLLSQAGTSTEPKNVRITNLSDSSATISLTTDTESITTISYGKETEAISQTLSDSRDKASSPSQRKTHYFTLENLSPNTTYFFTIQSGGDTYQDGAEPFQLTTGGQVTFTNTNDHTIAGKLITVSGEIAKDVLIYISSDTTQDFSTLTGLDGGFSIPLQNVRSKDLTQALSLTDDAIVSLVATDGEKETVSISRFENADPLPTMVLGSTYDFSSKQADSFVTNDTPDSTFPLDESQSDPNDPQILSPKKGESITNTKPLIIGKAKQNETVTIKITEKETLEAKVITNRQGQWSYRPTTALSQGRHTISITAKGPTGSTKTVSHSFTVISVTSPTKPPPSPTKISFAGNTALSPEPSSLVTPTVMLAMKSSQSVLGVTEANYPTPTEMVLMSKSSSLPNSLSPVMISSSVTLVVVVGIVSSLFFLKRDIFAV